MVEGKDGQNGKDSSGAEKGLKKLVRQRQGVLWLGGGLRTRQGAVFPRLAKEQ